MHEPSKSEGVHDNGYRTKFDKRGDARSRACCTSRHQSNKERKTRKGTAQRNSSRSEHSSIWLLDGRKKTTKEIGLRGMEEVELFAECLPKEYRVKKNRMKNTHFRYTRTRTPGRGGKIGK
jgi:hypothetical protein